MRWLSALLLAVLVLLGVAAWLVTSSDPASTQAARPAALGAADPERPPPAADLERPREDPGGPALALTPTPTGAERVARSEGLAEDEFEDGGSLVVAGRVLDPAGHPLAGAAVYGARSQNWTSAPLDSRFHTSNPWSGRHETTTGDDGRFTLRGLSPGAARLAVRAAGFAPHDADGLTLPTGSGPDAPHDLGDIQLGPGIVLWGRVVDPAGYGVAQAELVRVDEVPALFFTGGATERGALLATCGPDGGFRIDVLAPGPWKLMVLSSAHPDAVFEGTTETPEEGGLMFRLEAGVEITGRVEGEGRELGQVVVRANPPGDLRIDSLSGPLPWREATCGAGGAFVLGGLEPGASYRLRARSAEDRPWSTEWISDAVEVPAGARDVVLRVASAGTVVFRPVLAGSAGSAPLTELEVDLVHRQEGDEDQETVEWDDERLIHDVQAGTVSVTGIQLGPELVTTLTVRKEGFEPVSVEPFTLAEGETLDLGTIALRARRMMSVRVSDVGTGEPVEGATVELAVENLSPEWESHEERTGADGIARVPRAEGVNCRLSASAAGFAGAELPFRLAPGERTEEPAFELALLPGGTLEVLALEPSGVPATATTVTCTELIGEGQMSTTYSEQVGDDGLARFEDLSGGRYRAEVSGVEEQHLFRFGEEREAPAESRAEVEVVAGELVRITLKRPPRGSLSGRITEGGRALVGASLRLEASDGQSFHIPGLTDQPQARTDAGGRYRVGPLDAGPYELVIVHRSRVMETRVPIDLSEGEQELDVELPITVIEGRVSDAAGAPVEGARVDVARADGASQRSQSRIRFAMSSQDHVVFDMGGAEDPATRTDADGRYRLRGLHADVELVVSAAHPEHVTERSEPLELRPGDVVSRVDLRLADAGRIEANAMVEGAPLGDAVVRASFIVPEGEEDPGVGDVSQHTDGQGRALLGGLTPGAWSVQLEPSGWDEKHYPPPQVVVVTAGELARVDL